MIEKLTEKQRKRFSNMMEEAEIVEDNEARFARLQAKRESDLMLLGYNQCLLENELWPEGHTRQSWKGIIEAQMAKLGK